MLGILLLLVFGKLQESFFTENSRAWHWALAYTLLSGIWSAVFGISGTLLLGLVSLFLYTWGYFALLRRVSDSLLLWLAVYLLGALLPFLLAVAAVG
ncbi:hypothetical protein [Neisseria perflava]|uniref:hypothetical protein n=1 Tax=Neisseria perflava TaxID=33053 RepID=UPI0020A0197F|nr:hypothetical protein [Neisseria perflava]MCP1660293.1 hypothetical protein [Neisseria perflava]MCP1771544.1 hypothetical protein [Neisseria perflava]